MTLGVKKYGGTSMGSPERINKVAEPLARAYQTGESLVVVVSAMGDTTDDLLRLAYELSDHPPDREMDMLLSAGERISMALLSIALEQRGVPAVSFTGSQTGIITTDLHRNARIREVRGERVRAALQNRKVVIVAGFQGVSLQKEITTLGRGGSDTTAVALAAALEADRCEIFTDVSGVYSADPRLLPNARQYSELPYDLMIALAHQGAGVLHPRSVELAAQYGVPLWVKSSFSEHQEGTYVRNPKPQDLETYQVVGVSQDPSQFYFSLEGEEKQQTLETFFFETTTELRLPLQTLSVNHTSSGICIQGFSKRDRLSDWKALQKRLSPTLGVLSLVQERVPVSLVGYRFSQEGLFIQKILQLLTQEKKTPSYIQVSNLAASFAILEADAEHAVKILHTRFLSPGNEP